MAAVVIGMDPHKRSATIEVMAGDETVLGGGRYATDVAVYRAMLKYARQFGERNWAIEGCNDKDTQHGSLLACNHGARVNS